MKPDHTYQKKKVRSEKWSQIPPQEERAKICDYRKQAQRWQKYTSNCQFKATTASKWLRWSPALQKSTLMVRSTPRPPQVPLNAVYVELSMSFQNKIVESPVVVYFVLLLVRNRNWCKLVTVCWNLWGNSLRHKLQSLFFDLCLFASVLPRRNHIAPKQVCRF